MLIDTLFICSVPVDESDYQDPGFEEGEFTDGVS